VSLATRVLTEAAGHQAAPPILCAMFDTELFGHWWFEGPRFLGAVLDRAAASGLTLTSAGDHLRRHPPQEAIELPEGSWGDGGGHQVWLNPETRWTWEPVYAAEARFVALAGAGLGVAADPLLHRLLTQAGRALLLLEASDWQFLITTLSARDYAEQRLTNHAADFDRLATLAARRLENGPLSGADETFLAECERRDGLFPDFDWRGYAPEPLAAAHR
jgi:1,4-alpha-glucan branching enzyme